MLYKGKESEKEHKVIDKKDESLCCVPETNTILQLNHTSFFFLKSKPIKKKLSNFSLDPGNHFSTLCFYKFNYFRYLDFFNVGN